MFCRFCGAQVDDLSVFCSKCGKKIGTEEERPDLEVISNKTSTAVINPEEERKGLLIYLKDIRNLEFIISNIQSKIEALNKQKPYPFHYKSYLVKDCSGKLYAPREWYSKFSENITYYGDLNYYCFMYNGHEHRFCIRNGTFEFDKMLPLNEWRLKKLLTAPIATYSIWTSIGNDKESFWSSFDKERHDGWSYFTKRFRSAEFCHKQFVDCWNDFKETAEQGYQKIVDITDRITCEIDELEAACEKAKSMLQKTYSLNIIPNKFREIGPIYYITDYFESSNESLSSILFHLDLDQIKLQIGSVIENQRQAIINQSILISQNDEMIAQNEQVLKGLAAVGDSLDRNTSAVQNAATWAEVAANNAEANAWISAANYLFK